MQEAVPYREATVHLFNFHLLSNQCIAQEIMKLIHVCIPASSSNHSKHVV